MDALVREAAGGDLRQILELLHQLSPPGKSEITDYDRLEIVFAEIHRNKDYYLYICEHDNTVVATGSLLVQPNLSHNARPYAHLENVVTRSDFRGHGFGGQVVRHLLNIAKSRNCYKVVLNCEAKNTHFYQKCGFYKTINGEMRRDLPNG